MTTSPLPPARRWPSTSCLDGPRYPVRRSAGETVSLVTSSHDYWDTILVLLDADGSPVLGSDDSWKYFAAFDWIAPADGTYRMRVTFFRKASSRVTLRVTRK